MRSALGLLARNAEVDTHGQRLRAMAEAGKVEEATNALRGDGQLLRLRRSVLAPCSNWAIGFLPRGRPPRGRNCWKKNRGKTGMAGDVRLIGHTWNPRSQMATTWRGSWRLFGVDTEVDTGLGGLPVP